MNVVRISAIWDCKVKLRYHVWWDDVFCVASNGGREIKGAHQCSGAVGRWGWRSIQCMYKGGKRHYDVMLV